jgi:hypothetical protein
MPFTISEFAASRPYLYHLTARENLPWLLATRRLDTAAQLLEAAGATHHLRQKRREHLPLLLGEHALLLRDQAPLHEGNIEFRGATTFEDLIESLNGRVYFWPGDGRGPSDYGQRHFERYQGERPTLLRIRFDSLRAANPGVLPAFCQYNSGSPRCSGGAKSPRGPETFVAAGRFSKGVGGVVEVTFERSVRLPDDAEIADTYRGPWRELA